MGHKGGLQSSVDYATRIKANVTRMLASVRAAEKHETVRLWRNTSEGQWAAQASKKITELVRAFTRFNKIAIQGTPHMAVDKEAISLSRVYSYYSKCSLPLFYV